MALQISKDFSQNPVVDACVTTFKNITKANVYITITSGRDANQKLKTVVDLEKVFNGIYGNAIIRTVMENFAKSIDFELKFPFEPVCDFSKLFPPTINTSFPRGHTTSGTYRSVTSFYRGQLMSEEHWIYVSLEKSPAIGRPFSWQVCLQGVNTYRRERRFQSNINSMFLYFYSYVRT